jgi:putative spermidine/putrescine transport system substrate-binding protein
MDQDTTAMPRSVVDTPLDRRRFLKATAGVGLLTVTGGVLAACATDPISGPTATPAGPEPTRATGRYGGPAPVKVGGKLTFVVGGQSGPVFDARQKYIFDVLREDYDIDVTLVSDLDYALIEAQIRTGQIDWDVVDADAFFAARAAREGWLEPVDYDIVDASQLVDGAAKEFSILQGVGGHHIAWNTNQRYGEGAGPMNWQEWYDVDKFPGRRALRSGALQTLPGAAMGDGVAPADLYPLDLDRAFAALERVRDSVVKWVDGGQAMQELLLGGEADLVNFYTSRCVTLKAAGEPIDFRFEQGTAEEADLITIGGTQNRVQAMHAMAVAVNTPEYSKVLAEATNLGFSNKLGMEMVDPAIKPLLSTSPENLAKLAPAGNDWWAENQPMAAQRMAEWILG